MTLESALAVSGIIFAIGLYGVLAKRSAVVVLMSLELMFNAVVIAAVAFSRFGLPVLPDELSGGVVTPALAREVVRTALSGHAFALFIIAVGAAEVALGLALVIALYRSRETVEITDADLLKH